jgi:hypothetical protein
VRNNGIDEAPPAASDFPGVMNANEPELLTEPPIRQLRQVVSPVRGMVAATVPDGPNPAVLLHFPMAGTTSLGVQ